MHHCLQISEIVDLIVEEAAIAKARSKSSCLHPVAALAAVCRQFYEPAMNVLWRDLKDIYPLLCCFPSEYLNDTNDDNKRSAETVYTRVPPGSDWDHFLRNAARVRSLTIDFGDRNRPLRVLSTCRPGAQLFPSLRKLEWIGGSEKECELYASLLINPKLTHIDIACDIGSATTSPIFDALQSNASELKFFELKSNLWEADLESDILIAPALSRLISSFNSLSTLHTHLPLSPDAFICISALPSMRELFVKPTVAIVERLQRRDTTTPVFPALEVLKIYFEPSCDPTAVVQAITSSQLREFSMQEKGIDDTLAMDVLERIFQALSSHKSLRSVSLPISPASPDKAIGLKSSDPSRELCHLQPLLSLSAMNTFRAQHIPFDLTNDCLTQIASWWPHIQHLDLGSSAVQHSSQVTMVGLHALTTRCKQLRNIGLVFDASDSAVQN
ncbi:unnamed protein product [Somion occarium]|uniref:F-box domain-containing protein n=1 Tax=Somion occarium TaxID=3059160 RepID=A0ABP1DSR4_9APHY